MHMLKKIYPLVIGVTVLWCAGVAQAAWVGPTATAPGNNVDAPINVSASSQTKNGNFYIGTGFGFSTPTLCLGVDCRSTWPSAGTSLWTLTGNNLYPATMSL